ncbi:MAG: hypothetical protein WCP89_02260 [archaeon]
MKIQEKPKKKTKVIVLVVLGQFLLIGAILFFVYLSAPRLEAPLNGAVIREDFVQFKFSGAEMILVDDNEDFSSPKMLNVSDLSSIGIGMKPGKYYWKAVGNVESFTRSFVIDSNVGLELNKNESKLKNVGNVETNVTKEYQGTLGGLVILDVGVEYNVNMTNETIYRGEQNG